MKKIISLMLVFILCFSLCACGSSKGMSEAVAMELNGSHWEIGQSGKGASWSFNDGRVEITTYIMGLEMSDTGSYEVTDKCIKFNWDEADNGRVDELYYTFENNTLRLFSDEKMGSELRHVS